MSNQVKTILILVLVTLSVYAGRNYNSPDSAAMNCTEITQYLNRGFTLDACTPNAYRYREPPTGTYAWGEVMVQLHGRTGGPMSLETTYVTVKCYVQARDQGHTVRYIETDNVVTETIVY